MKKYFLEATMRTITGRKVKQLRKKKLLPGNVYGKKIKSTSVEIPLDTFSKVYAVAGETGIVELKLGSEIRLVLIHNVQVHPVNAVPLHVDFFQVDLKEKIKANVPVEITGTAGAVSQKLGVLLTLSDEIEVEALPTELPEKIVIDVTKLNAVGDTIKVSDVTLPSGVVVVTKGDTEVVKIGSLVTKEAEKLAAEEAAAKAAAQAETVSAVPAAEGGAPAATEVKAPEAGKASEVGKAPAKPAAEAKKA